MNPDLYIAGVGVYLPERQTVEDAIANGQYKAEQIQLDEVRSVGVEKNLYPAEMAAAAGRDALAMAGGRAGAVRAVFHSYLNYQGAEFWDAAPYVALNTVGAAVPAYDVRQSCNGALASIELGRRFINSNDDSVLITTGDRFDNRYVNRWSGDQSVFGDGGAGLVLSGAGGFARVTSLVTLAENALEAESRGGEFGPADAVIDFEDKRERFHTQVVPMMEHYVKLEGVLHECIEKALAEAGTTTEDLAYAIPVVTTKWRVQIQLSRFLGLDLDKSTWDFGSTTGHVGSGDQITGLHHLYTNGKLAPGDKVLLVGGGTGFTVTVAVLEITEGGRV
jgi:3-oxoacyl-[acyl-carrier-protein] synthase-3